MKNRSSRSCASAYSAPQAHSVRQFLRAPLVSIGGALLTASMIAGCQNQNATQPQQATASAQAPASQASAFVSAPATPSAPLVTGLPDFTLLAERVAPSVVNIRVMEKIRKNPFSSRGSGDPMEELLRRFFGITPNQAPRRNHPLPDGNDERPTGVGSGFIISADGYIMTNAHVVSDADSLIVTLADKREFRGKVIGQDKRTDVAIIKIDGENLPTVTIGDVNALKVGQWVVAIGSPFGLENTVTAGIVSAKHRDTGEYLPFIQTDVAINPGNSGGPLINMAGEVVGINSQIYSRSGGFMGISFSIPIDEAMRIAEQLRTSGTVTRGRIGVQIAPINKEVAASMGLKAGEGALVRSVEVGEPADKAGIRPGDIITRVNGKPLERTSDLPRIIGDMKPGSQAALTILRNGKNQDITLTVAQARDENASSPLTQKNNDATPGATANAFGISVTELTPAQRKQQQISGGVLVQNVAPDSPAERTGLQAGDIILSIANQATDSVASFNAITEKLPKNQAVTVLILRDGMAQYGILRAQN